MTSHTTRTFRRLFDQLPFDIQERARKAFRQFLADPSHPSLSFERLVSHPDLWAARISADYRAVCKVVGGTAYWLWIGSHRDFDRQFPRG
ncbi:MAG TPA: hypothetical protein PKG54_01590 [Phycisphaerae bacterium]|nr:hypothetical protein [Phycisphaerae bacterium]HOB73194.1 hypothetical protein [Phycisphaerae bacterium]HOJ55107.1 hypothetical protein [Phycisphaerae bacterium]HOL27927.1 hypothetical protein [Phycisphaerae bacterium]HPP21730.1 hypothetical protein [Phycisphaerae bacterium]